MKRSLQLVSIIVCLFFVFISGCAISPSPGIDLKTAGDSITEAREAIALARNEKAPENAPQEFAKAESLLEQAQKMLRKRQNQNAVDISFQAAMEAKIATAMSRGANARYRVEKAKENKQEVMWEAKNNEVALAKVHQAIAEKVALEAQTNSEISGDLAEKEVQKNLTELAIAKAEMEINFAAQMMSARYAEQSYNDSMSSLQEAKTALAAGDFQKATSDAETAAKHAANAAIQAKAKSEIENAENTRKRDRTIAAIAKAEVSVDEAKTSQASQYAKDLYDASEKALQDAKSALEKKEYERADSLAEKARVSASSAYAVVQVKKKEEKTKEDIEEAMANALDAVAKAEKILPQAFSAGAADDLAKDDYSQAQAALERARQAMLDKDYEKAVSNAQESVFNSNVAVAKAEIKNLREKKIDDLEKSILEEASKIPEVHVRKAEKGIIISISNDILAKTGEVKNEVKPGLKAIAEILKKHPDCIIIIQGHTDNSGVEKSNLKISSDRASSLLGYMSAVEGIPLGRLSSIGFGQSQPIASNADEAGRKQNRRLDIFVLTRNQ